MAELSDNFEDMYKGHYKMLRNAAENIIGDADSAHDVVQDVFVKLWNRRDEVSAILNVKAYLFRSVINTSLTYLENNKNKTRIGELKIESSGTTDSPLLTKELEVKIQTALNNLPPKCKAIFALSRFEGLKNKEIAEQLGLSLKTVENQMGIALKKMKEDLKYYLPKESFFVFFLFGFSVILELF
ncbi:RNA polymerase sigma-70 factor [Aurantibacillus circumpalustris]|uniref:RNA polymerase sigma-70 factor n=1 Tax=Aurantibacillus circumpalustris TaxID=3036359 RepID=UPI00295AAAE3|nr:RNA polymerase sigma-70 factor [Aurantibacillus circumpalustris]